MDPFAGRRQPFAVLARWQLGRTSGQLGWNMILQMGCIRAGSPIALFLLTSVCHSESNMGKGMRWHVL